MSTIGPKSPLGDPAVKPLVEFVVHTEAQGERLIQEHGIAASNIHVTGIVEDFLGIVKQRDYIISNLVSEGEWYCSVDDNIEYVSRLVDPFYSHFDPDGPPDGLEPPEAKRDYFNHVVTGPEFVTLFDELRRKCESQSTIYGGFGWLDVPFYRMKKWRWNGYVKAKAIVHRSDGVAWRWDEKICIMSDHAKTYDTLARYGSVVVNQHVYVDAKRWSEGGIGSHESRLPGRKQTCEFLYSYFGDMLRMVKGEVDNPRFTFTSRAKFDEWRASVGYNI